MKRGGERGNSQEGAVDMAAGDVGDGGRGPLIGHMDHLRTGFGGEQRAEKMRRGADAEGAVGDGLVGGSLDVPLKIGNRRACRDRQNESAIGHQADGIEALQHVAHLVFVQHRRDGVGRGGSEEQRVSVGGLRHHIGPGHRAARARTIVNDNRRAERRFQLGRDETGEKVRPTTG